MIVFPRDECRISVFALPRVNTCALSSHIAFRSFLISAVHIHVSMHPLNLETLEVGLMFLTFQRQSRR